MKSNNTFSIAFITRLNKNNKRKANIYARIMVNGQRIEISSKEQVEAEQWDQIAEKVKGKAPFIKSINNHIDDIRYRLKKNYLMLEEKNFPITADAVKEAFLGIHKSQDGGHNLIELIDYHFKIGKDNLKQGTLKNYLTTEEYIRRFLKSNFKSDNILLKELDFQFITELEYYIRNNPIKKHDPCNGNGVMKHMERLKKLIHWAKQLKWISENPFEEYKLSLIKYKRKKINLVELKRIENKEFANPKLSYVRDLFLFSCYTGLPYAEVSSLKSEDFHTENNGKQMIEIYRKKTDELSSIPLLDIARPIIEKYRLLPKAIIAGTIFPPISNQELNRNLKIIAEVCEINTNMTFHLARHTFATVITLKNGVPMETVSKMLGHTKISTTKIYASVDDEKIMEDMAQAERKMLERRES